MYKTLIESDWMLQFFEAALTNQIEDFLISGHLIVESREVSILFSSLYFVWFFFLMSLAIESTYWFCWDLSCSKLLLNLWLWLLQSLNFDLAFSVHLFFLWGLSLFLFSLDFLLGRLWSFWLLLFIARSFFCDKLFHCWYII